MVNKDYIDSLWIIAIKEYIIALIPNPIKSVLLLLSYIGSSANEEKKNEKNIQRSIKFYLEGQEIFDE